MIAIINYGVGNLGSIQNMFKYVGYPDVLVTKNIDDINSAEKLVLPGVGAFDAGMEKIHQSGLLETLNKNVLEQKKPVLGICLGMQLLTRKSEEGVEAGLGWIDAETIKFKFDSDKKNLKIPHMGWNEVKVSKGHPFLNGLTQPARFYFVHSYYVKCHNPEDELLSCRYGVEFSCAVQYRNIMGVQFHAEKSHKFGMQLLKNFGAMAC
jgi:glutamine amidotransferase